jgi:hypothetical protein
MKLKTDWKQYIQNIRIKEIEIIEPILFKNRIDKGLEIGAGNGFQSSILKKHINKLYCTELNKERLIKKDIEGITYKILDAELIDRNFSSKYFNFIYSSNLFEHLPNPHLAIDGTKEILSDNGIIIHIIPSPFSVILRIMLWYPNIILSILEKLLTIKSKDISVKNKTTDTATMMGNNMKLEKSSTPKIIRLLIPTPHGVSKSIFSEIGDMRKILWKNRFEKSGFEIIKIVKGPIYSGYGIGLSRAKEFLDKAGLTSEYIYIMKKAKI